MEERQLPVGWEATCLADVSEKIVDGSHNPPKSTEEGLPMLSARNIADRRIEFDVEHRLISPYDFEVEHRRTEVAGGDVLLTIVGAIGRTAVVPETCPPFTLQRSVSVIKPSACIGSDFLSYMLESPEIQAFLLDNAKGTAQKGIYLKQLQRLPIQIAPLSEQGRIAAKLDTTLAAVDACRQRLDGVEALLKRFRQAVLEAYTNGQSREGTEEWKACQISEVCEVVRGASPRPAGDPKFFTNETSMPWITVGEITKDNQKYLHETKSFLTEEGVRRSRFIEEGTLLLTNSGATLGVPKITLIGGCINDGSVALLGLDEPLKSYLYYMLASRTRMLREINQGAAQPNLNTSIVKSIAFEMPVSSQRQADIVAEIESLLSLADQLEAKLTATRQVVERLTPALLAKAFRGELVPQDPSDEPASVLLERIRAARQAEAAAGKPSRRGRRKAADPPEQAPRPVAPAPPDLLAQLLQECGALSERALLAASELDPAGFRAQLALEQDMGAIRETAQDGQVLLEAVV